MKTVLLDSSIWISSILKRDVFVENADEIINFYLNNNFLIILPEIVLFEILNVLRRNKVSNIELEKRRRFFNRNSKIKIVKTNVEKLTKTFLNTRESIVMKSQDCLIAMSYVYFQVDKYETFDHKLLKNLNKLEYEKNNQSSK